MTKDALIYYALIIGVPLLAFVVIILLSSRPEPKKRETLDLNFLCPQTVGRQGEFSGLFLRRGDRSNSARP